MKQIVWLLGLVLMAWPVYGQTPPSSVFIEDMTWPEVRDAIAAGKRTAIVYVGSIEQNGPHMALGKHNFVARCWPSGSPKSSVTRWCIPLCRTRSPAMRRHGPATCAFRERSR